MIYDREYDVFAVSFSGAIKLLLSGQAELALNRTIPVSVRG
jgi:hypothetical protein